MTGVGALVRVTGEGAPPQNDSRRGGAPHNDDKGGAPQNDNKRSGEPRRLSFRTPSLPVIPNRSEESKIFL